MDIEVQKILNDIGSEVVYQMQEKLLKMKPYPRRATSTLVNSIDYEIKDNKLIVHYSDYGPNTINSRTGVMSGNMDQGRRKGKFVPIQPLLDWMKTKRIKFRDQDINKKGKETKYNTKDVLSKFQKKRETAEQKSLKFAYAISRHLSENPIPPSDFTQPLMKLRSPQKTSGDKFKEYLKNIFKKK